MAGILSLRDIELRKQALVAESEAYRLHLHVERQRMALHAAQVRQSLGKIRPFLALLGYVAPLGKFVPGLHLANRVFGRKRGISKLRLLGMAFAAWRLYPKLMPALRLVAARRRAAAMRQFEMQGSSLGESGMTPVEVK